MSELHSQYHHPKVDTNYTHCGLRREFVRVTPDPELVTCGVCQDSGATPLWVMLAGAVILVIVALMFTLSGCVTAQPTLDAARMAELRVGRSGELALHNVAQLASSVNSGVAPVSSKLQAVLDATQAKVDSIDFDKLYVLAVVLVGLIVLYEAELWLIRRRQLSEFRHKNVISTEIMADGSQGATRRFFQTEGDIPPAGGGL